MAFFRGSNESLYFKFFVNKPERGRIRSTFRIALLPRRYVAGIYRFLLVATVLIVVATLIGDVSPSHPFGSETTSVRLMVVSIGLLALAAPFTVIGRINRVDFAMLRLDVRLTREFYWLLSAVALEASIGSAREAYGPLAIRIFFWVFAAVYFLAFVSFVSKPTRVKRTWERYGGLLVSS